MPINFGSTGIGEIYYGSTPIKEVYSGGTLVWSSGPSWPQTGSWSGNTTSTTTTYATFTVPEAGVYDFEWSVTWGGTGNVYGQSSCRINGGSSTSGDVVASAPGTATVARTGVALSTGDVIEFRAGSVAGTRAATGAWAVNYVGAELPWQPLPERVNFEDAYSSPFRVVYAGSSTTQGYQQPQYETYAQLLTARIARQSPGADAAKMIKRTSGSQTLPTANGFHFLNVGLGGTTSANYLDSTKRALANNFQPKFVVHMIGSNDYSQQMAIATYKSNIESALNNMQSTFHVLVHTYRREDRADTGITWAQYGQALKDIADSRPNVMFVDASQDWQDRRNGANDWLQGDNIHTSWKGAQGLSEAVADGMGLEVHAGATVWGFGQAEIIAANPGGGAVASLAPTPVSLAQVNATQGTSGARPYSTTSASGYRTLDFALNGVRDLDTPGFGAFSFPITFYAVCNTRYTNTSHGTAQQPIFSRSVANDDGWWWVWQDRGVPNIAGALNSAFSPTFNYGSDNLPILYAVHMTANNRASVYVNSLTPRTVLAPDQIAEDSGPWMKSIRLGANSGRTNYTGSMFREMSWELSDYEQSDVQARLTALASQYGITLDP